MVRQKMSTHVVTKTTPQQNFFSKNEYRLLSIVCAVTPKQTLEAIGKVPLFVLPRIGQKLLNVPNIQNLVKIIFTKTINSILRFQKNQAFIRNNKEYFLKISRILNFICLIEKSEKQKTSFASMKNCGSPST